MAKGQLLMASPAILLNTKQLALLGLRNPSLLRGPGEVYRQFKNYH
jgi:hypothetical protein